MRPLKIGCSRPTGSRVGEEGQEVQTIKKDKEVIGMAEAKVGYKAPDFEAPAYQNGEFGQVKLSDYIGKWVILCFYPGDFTFV